MLTVAEALNLEAFQGAKVVAGHNGLDKTISWVHNPAVIDAATWLNGGEFVVTTYNNLPQDAESQRAYLQALIDKGVVGLALAVGQMIDHMPPVLIPIADEQDFPLIEISYKVRFVDIERAANERISQDNMAMVTRALDIHQRLTQLVLEGGGMQELASTLAALVNQSVSIETERFEAIANHNIGAVDEARRYTQQYGRTDPRLVAALEDEVLPEIRRTLRPVFIPQMPHVGLEMERILAPVVMRGEIYGFVWLIADDRPLTDLDRMAIESAATIAALMRLYEKSVQDAEASLKGNLLARLIQNDIGDTSVITDQALRYGVSLDHDFRVLLIQYPLATSSRLLRLYRDVNHLVSAERRPVIIGQYAGHIMLLAQAGESPRQLIREIRTQLDDEEAARIGVSGMHRQSHNVKYAYMQCREVLDIARRLDQPTQDVYFDDLGYLHALYHAGPDALDGNPLVSMLVTLRREQQADLFHTLEAYLDAGGNGVLTAETLHIHRSTLNYRLQRITEILGTDLSDPAMRLNLQVALKLLRLFGEDVV